MQPDISIIVPCYNHARYIGDALRSILEQNTPVRQIIVVDDGSSDDSVAIAATFVDKVTVVQQSHRGAAAARNAGLERAEGDYIAFLDADDLWPSGSLSSRLDLLESSREIELAYGWVEQFFSSEFGESERACIALNNIPILARQPGSILVRRNTVERIGGFDETLRSAETLDWDARLQEDGALTAFADQIVLKRRVHGKNTVLTQGDIEKNYLRVVRNSLRRRAGATSPSASAVDTVKEHA